MFIIAIAFPSKQVAPERRSSVNIIVFVTHDPVLVEQVFLAAALWHPSIHHNFIEHIVCVRQGARDIEGAKYIMTGLVRPDIVPQKVLLTCGGGSSAEGGATAEAFAAASAKAFAAGGAQAQAFARAYAAAIAQYGCDQIKPLLTRESPGSSAYAQHSHPLLTCLTSAQCPVCLNPD